MTEWIPCEERLPEKELLKCLVKTKWDEDFIAKFENKKFFTEWFLREGKEIPIKDVIYWAPLPEMPKKKRWRPKEDEKYFFISSDYDKIEGRLWVNKGVYWNDECKRSFLGVYKTKEEAELIRDKIKKFVEAEIGEP